MSRDVVVYLVRVRLQPRVLERNPFLADIANDFDVTGRSCIGSYVASSMSRTGFKDSKHRVATSTLIVRDEAQASPRLRRETQSKVNGTTSNAPIAAAVWAHSQYN